MENITLLGSMFGINKYEMNSHIMRSTWCMVMRNIVNFAPSNGARPHSACAITRDEKILCIEMCTEGDDKLGRKLCNFPTFSLFAAAVRADALALTHKHAPSEFVCETQQEQSRLGTRFD